MSEFPITTLTDDDLYLRIEYLAEEMGMDVGEAFEQYIANPCDFTRTLAGTTLGSYFFLVGCL